MTFGARLQAAMVARGPLCAGIDPHSALLLDWGLNDDLVGLERFSRVAVEGLAPYVAAVKPQSAFYERFGSRGIAVLERVIVDARAAGTQVILDVKRGDIGSTTQAYADAYLDQTSPMAVDAITASPFLGFGSLDPMFETARVNAAGVFVLALTSNPEGHQIQGAITSTGGTVAGAVLNGLRTLNVGAGAMGSFGAVVGGTIGSTKEDLSMSGPLLVPGIGAQGGTASDIQRLFGGVLGMVLPSSSRDILSVGPDPSKLRDQACRTNDELRVLLRDG